MAYTYNLVYTENQTNLNSEWSDITLSINIQPSYKLPKPENAEFHIIILYSSDSLAKRPHHSSHYA